MHCKRIRHEYILKSRTLLGDFKIAVSVELLKCMVEVFLQIVLFVIFKNNFIGDDQDAAFKHSVINFLDQ